MNRYFWYFKISYLWYGAFGFIVTCSCGWLFSVLFTALNVGGESKIYLDNNKRYYNTDLFSPPIARNLKKQNADKLANDANVSLFITII